MSYYLIDFTKNINDYNFDNLIIGKKINTKHYIYYQNIDEYEEPKEIYIKLPKIRSIYKLGLSKYNQENIPLYPHYNLLNNFIEFIKELENNIHECFINKYPDIILSSIINKRNNILHIKVNIIDNYIISSNINNNIKLNDIKINSELQIVVKLSFIWNKDNYKIGLSCELYQIKYNPIPYDMNINFFDNINTNNIIQNNNIIQDNINNKLPISTNVINKGLNIINTPNIVELPKPSLIPSIADLQGAIKKLKPIKSD